MSEKSKKIVLLIILCVFTISVLIIALKFNENRIKQNLLISKIDDYLVEINYEEISDYIVEQPSVIIYVSNSSKEKNFVFEKNFINIIRKYNLENEFVYININETLIVDPVYQNSPELVIYENGEIIDIIDCNTLKSSKDILEILIERRIIND